MPDDPQTQLEQCALECIWSYGLGPHFARVVPRSLTTEEYEVLIAATFDPWADPQHEDLRRYLMNKTKATAPTGDE